MPSLKNPAVRGTLWTLLEYGALNILRFGSNLVLTQLLVPEFFGLMALANTLRMGLELLSDLGIDQSIIQNKRGDDPDFLNTAWTLKVLRGGVLFGFSLVLAWPLAQWYGDSRLMVLIPLVGLSSILEGLTSTFTASMNRQMALGINTLIELIGVVFAIGVLVGWAWVSPTVWALGIGGLSGPLYRVIVSHGMQQRQFKFRNWFAWDSEAVAAIVGFGRSLFFSTALMFLSEQADRFILAKLTSFEMLGVYTIASTLAALPREVLKNLSFRVLFPIAARSAELPRRDLRHQIVRQRSLILLGTLVCLGILTAWGDLLISALYNERYEEATWMLPILAVGVWFSALFYTLSPSLLAIAQPIYQVYSNLGRLIFISIGLLVGYSAGGIQGAVSVAACADLCAYLILLYGLQRQKLLALRQDLMMSLLFVGVISVNLLVRSCLGLGLPLIGSGI